MFDFSLYSSVIYLFCRTPIEALYLIVFAIVFIYGKL